MTGGADSVVAGAAVTTAAGTGAAWGFGAGSPGFGIADAGATVAARAVSGGTELGAGVTSINGLGFAWLASRLSVASMVANSGSKASILGVCQPCWARQAES